MAYYYSLGITFPTQIEAEKCKEIFSKNEIILSDGSFIRYKFLLVEKTEIKKKLSEEFIFSVFIEGLEVPNRDLKLFSKPYFYEIRKNLYDFICHLNLQFDLAWWEFEAADQLKDDDVLLEINKNGIGEKMEGDQNASFCSNLPPSYYESKRLYDGLIVSEKKFNELKCEISAFETFKQGYFWLPIDMNYR